MVKIKNKDSYVKRIDFIIYFVLAVFFLFNLTSFNYNGADKFVVLSFFLLGIFFFFKIISADKNISLYRVLYIFAFIFLFYAPLQQYLSGTVLWQDNGLSLVYNNKDYLQANIVIFIFTLCFEIGYKFTHMNGKAKNKKYIVIPSDFSAIVLLIISLLSVVILFLTGNIIGKNGFNVGNVNLSNQINNILRFIPVSCLLLTILQARRSGKANKILLAIYLLEVLIIFFPFNGSVSRFLLFGAYLTIFSLLFSKAECKSLFFLIYVVGFFFIFSSFNYFKYNTIKDLSGFILSFANFNYVDFDAYQLLMASINYAEEAGTMCGQNILTVLLCFIPRSIWGSKMDPSGQIVAEYWGAWFTNLSCPLPAEFFLAFGYVGVIIGSLFTGFLFKKIDGFDFSNSYFKKSIFCILSGLLVFILRGALLPVISYSIALSFSVFFVCFVNDIFSKVYIRKMSKCAVMKNIELYDK